MASTTKLPAPKRRNDVIIGLCPEQWNLRTLCCTALLPESAPRRETKPYKIKLSFSFNSYCLNRCENILRSRLSRRRLLKKKKRSNLSCLPCLLSVYRKRLSSLEPWPISYKRRMQNIEDPRTNYFRQFPALSLDP